VLREDQSGLTGEVTTASDKVPKPGYALSIDFSCARSGRDLVKRLFLEISRCGWTSCRNRTSGRARALMRESRRLAREPLAVARITDAYENGDDVRRRSRTAVNRTLTRHIQEAHGCTSTRNYVRVTLCGEEVTSDPGGCLRPRAGQGSPGIGYGGRDFRPGASIHLNVVSPFSKKLTICLAAARPR